VSNIAIATRATYLLSCRYWHHYTTRIRFQISIDKIDGFTRYTNARYTPRTSYYILYTRGRRTATCKSIASISHFFSTNGSFCCASVGNHTLQCSFKPLCRKTTVFESRQLSSWSRAICFSVWTTDCICVLLINWQYGPLRHRTRGTDNQTLGAKCSLLLSTISAQYSSCSAQTAKVTAEVIHFF